MDENFAARFASEWIDAFNSHDLDRILSHYDESIEFYSPFIVLLSFNADGMIKGKAALRQYFEKGLFTYPDLQFQLLHYYTGINTLVLQYHSVNNLVAAETFQINHEGRAIKVWCHYTIQ